MEMLDRYLKSVRSALPDAQRDDIIRELSENIHSEIEDKESELGRPLNETEMEALLKQHGNPLIVASRYRQDTRSLSFGRQLIGPMLFPFYTKVLTFNMGLTAVVILIIFTALSASGQKLGVSGALETLFYNLLIQFSVITLIFTAMDRHLTKYPDRWDAKKPNAAHFPALAEQTSGLRVSRMESVSQLIALAIFLVWLHAIRDVPFLVFGPAAAFLKAAPMWGRFYIPVLAVTLISMLQSAMNLVRPDWVRLRSLARVTSNAVGLVMEIFLIKAGTWVVPTSDASAGYRQAAMIANQVIFYSLIVATIFTIALLIHDFRRLVAGGATPFTTKSAAHH